MLRVTEDELSMFNFLEQLFLTFFLKTHNSIQISAVSKKYGYSRKLRRFAIFVIFCMT